MFPKFEHHLQPLLPASEYYRRLAGSAGMAVAILAVSLALGMLGYHLSEHLTWTDSFLNASMILGGMGPVTELRTEAGKLFAGVYALYSGVIFLLAVGVLFAPVVHRIMHRFHLPTGDEDSTEEEDQKTAQKTA